MWLIEGLQDDRFALISKNHHALVDGISGVDLATVLFDLSPDPPPIRHSGRAWQPHREPSAVELTAAAFRGALRAGRRSRPARSMRSPTPTVLCSEPVRRPRGSGRSSGPA